MSASPAEPPAGAVPSLPHVPSLNNQMGVVLICTCIGCMLFGLTTHQTYRYFRLYPTDGWRLKAFVLVLLLLDTFHSVLSIHICYYYLVNNYFFPLSLLNGVWSIRLIIVETGCVIVLAHCFYARRMFLLSGGRVIPILLIGLLLVTEFALCIASTVEAFLQPAFSQYEHFTWLICSALGTAVFVDLFVTASLIVYLRRSRTGFKRTDSLVDILMVYAINTGLSTSVISLAAAITAITMPDNHIYSGIYIIASKMYANSLLAVLNSRRSIIDRGLEGFETGSFGMKVVEPGDVRAVHFNVPASPKKEPQLPSVIDVRVTKETFVDGLPAGSDAGDWDSSSDNGRRPCDSAASLENVV
ncbi:hypothetical protein C8Q73DRAFT_4440 [Cubamyces lactineus]|nr:hypothetical protein C8Q73DRAFT_4440 [Cubamyces lactineus]